MKNLAGDENANLFIAEELAIAGLKLVEVAQSNGEVPYRFIGELNGWTFTRAWYYWIASSDKGLPMDVAEKLHSKRYPLAGIEDFPKTYGAVIRAGGHCMCPNPRKYPGGDCVRIYHIDTQLGLNRLAQVIRQQKD